MTGSSPELAVVVLAVGAPPELRTALESLGRQTVPVEIVVVNSGGGDPWRVLPEGLDARVVSVPERLWPGAARNLGIRKSRAPWVSFMASDHVVKNDWAFTRLEFHRRGHRAVACAVVNSHPGNLFACAYHFSILAQRLPGIPPQDASLHGVSYSRSLFERHGEFREDLRIGEDTEFNSRLRDTDRPLWVPSVQTTHRNPTTFGHMVKSQYERGRRSGLHWPHWHQGQFMVRARARFWLSSRDAYRATRGRERCLVIASLPLILVCVVAYSLGVAAARRQRSGGEGAPDIQWTAPGTGTVARPSLAGDLSPSATEQGSADRTE